MPFDSLVRDTVVDPLVRLGITPIPQETVKAYKKAYRIKAYRIAALKRTRHYPEDFRWATRRQGKCGLESFLNHPLPYDKASFADDRTPVPDALAGLARTVRAVVPDAEFTVDFLSADPVLNVKYDFNGQRVKACLGIWEAGEILMIATVA